MTANQKFSRFIGIDVSKAKLDIYDDATGEFLTVENTAKAIEKYVSALSPDPELLIVVDLTGGYEALCVNTFYNRGFTVHRAEGRRVKAFMRSYGEHAKTDRIDAYALALFGRKLHETLRMYTPLPLNLKPVTERISDLKTMLLQEKNRSTAPSLPPDMKKEIVRHIAYLEKEIERLYQKCLDIIKNDPPLAEAFYKIIAIKGIAEKSAVLRFHGTGDVVESDFERLHAVPREVGNRGVAGIQTALHGDRFERFARESLHAAFLRFEGAVAVDYRDVGRGSGVAHAHLADAPRFALALPFEHQRHVAVMTDDGRQVGVGLGLAVARNPVARMVAFTGDAHPFVDLGDVAFDDRFGGVDFQRPFRQISSRQGRSGVATKPSWGANGRSNRVCDCAEFSAPYRPPSSNSSGSSFLVMADNC